jgi:3-dehydro-4-phosphotetronate decarboxylase
MNESFAREEICRIGKSLFDRGYVHATAGNISIQLEDALLITPSDACLGFLDPARLAKMGRDGQQQSGDRASKTVVLHQAIYQSAKQFSPNTQCVIHTHSTHCVSLSMQRDAAELLQAITPYFVMKVGHVPLIAYDYPGSPAIAKQVAQTITNYGQANKAIRAVMLQRLGPNVWHDSPSAAMATIEELEETAKLVCLSNTPIPALTDEQINQLRTHFSAIW